VSQWIPLHSLNPDIVRSLVRTFYESFPECCMWFINADVFMIGSDQPLQVDYSLLEQRIASRTVQQELARVELGDIEELLVCFFMSKGKVDAYSRGASIMTDDRPWAEFAAPKEVYTSTVDVSLGEMMPFYENPTAILTFRDMTDASIRRARERLDRRYRAHIQDLRGEIAYYGAGPAMGDPTALFKGALVIDQNDLTAPFYIKEIALAQAGYCLGAGRVAAAVDVLTDAIRQAPHQADLYAQLGGIYHRQLEQYDKALEYYEGYLKAGGRSKRIANLCKSIRASLNENPPSARE